MNEIFSRRLDAVIEAVNAATSQWAFDYWSNVREQLLYRMRVAA